MSETPYYSTEEIREFIRPDWPFWLLVGIAMALGATALLILAQPLGLVLGFFSVVVMSIGINGLNKHSKILHAMYKTEGAQELLRRGSELRELRRELEHLEREQDHIKAWYDTERMNLGIDYGLPDIEPPSWLLELDVLLHADKEVLRRKERTLHAEQHALLAPLYMEAGKDNPWMHIHQNN